MSQAEPNAVALKLLRAQTRAAVDRIFNAGGWTAGELSQLGAHLVGMAPLACPPGMPPDECRAAMQTAADYSIGPARKFSTCFGIAFSRRSPATLPKNDGCASASMIWAGRRERKGAGGRCCWSDINREVHQ